MATRKYGNQEFANLRRWLDANQDSASERMVRELECLIGQDYPAVRVVPTSSCMGALHLALVTIGVGPGDEVIVDPIVVFGGMAAVYQHATPIFADVDRDTFNLDPQSIAERITPNYQMAGVVAALALAQWDAAKQYVRADHELAQLYTDAIQGCTWLIPQSIPNANWCAYHIWGAVYRGDEVGIPYDAFMAALRESGGDYFLPSFIPSGAFGLIPSPVYRYPLFNERRPGSSADHDPGCPQRYEAGLCPNAEYLVPRLFNTLLSAVEDERIRRYADALYRTVSSWG